MTISGLVYSQGGTMMDVFPLKEMFTINSRPYLHANLGPIFLIGDGSVCFYFNHCSFNSNCFRWT